MNGNTDSHSQGGDSPSATEEKKSESKEVVKKLKKCIRKGDRVCYTDVENIMVLKRIPETEDGHKPSEASLSVHSEKVDSYRSGESLFKTFTFEQTGDVNDQETQKCIAFWQSIMEKNLAPIKCTILEADAKKCKKEEHKPSDATATVALDKTGDSKAEKGDKAEVLSKLDADAGSIKSKSPEEAPNVPEKQTQTSEWALWAQIEKEVRKKKLDMIKLLVQPRCKMCEDINVKDDVKKPVKRTESELREIKNLNNAVFSERKIPSLTQVPKEKKQSDEIKELFIETKESILSHDVAYLKKKSNQPSAATQSPIKPLNSQTTQRSNTPTINTVNTANSKLPAMNAYVTAINESAQPNVATKPPVVQSSNPGKTKEKPDKVPQESPSINTGKSTISSASRAESKLAKPMETLTKYEVATKRADPKYVVPSPVENKKHGKEPEVTNIAPPQTPTSDTSKEHTSKKSSIYQPVQTPTTDTSKEHASKKNLVLQSAPPKEESLSHPALNETKHHQELSLSAKPKIEKTTDKSKDPKPLEASKKEAPKKVIERSGEMTLQKRVAGGINCLCGCGTGFCSCKDSRILNRRLSDLEKGLMAQKADEEISFVFMDEPEDPNRCLCSNLECDCTFSTKDQLPINMPTTSSEIDTTSPFFKKAPTFDKSAKVPAPPQSTPTNEVSTSDKGVQIEPPPKEPQMIYCMICGHYDCCCNVSKDVLDRCSR